MTRMAMRSQAKEAGEGLKLPFGCPGQTYRLI